MMVLNAECETFEYRLNFERYECYAHGIDPLRPCAGGRPSAPLRLVGRGCVHTMIITFGLDYSNNQGEASRSCRVWVGVDDSLRYLCWRREMSLYRVGCFSSTPPGGVANISVVHISHSAWRSGWISSGTVHPRLPLPARAGEVNPLPQPVSCEFAFLCCSKYSHLLYTFYTAVATAIHRNFSILHNITTPQKHSNAVFLLSFSTKFSDNRVQ